MTNDAQTSTKSSSSTGAPGLLRNVLSNWSALLVASVVNFALSPFIVHHLGNNAYGAWVLLNSLVGYLGLVDLGVRAAVTRYVASLHARGHHEAAGRVASTALSVFLGAGSVAILAASLAAWFGISLVRIPTALVPEARAVLVIGGVTIAASLVGGLFGGIIVGLQRFDYENGITIGTTLFRAAVIVVALDAGYGIVSLACIQLASSLVTTAASLVCSRHLYPHLKVRLGTWDAGHARLVMTFGVAVTIMQVARTVMAYTDSVVIGVVLPISQVAFYAIASNLTLYVQQVGAGISMTMMPMTSALAAAQSDRDALTRPVVAACRLATLVTLPILTVLLFRGSSFIGLWMGPQYAAPSGAVLYVLAVGAVPASAMRVFSSAALGMNKHKTIAWASVAEVLTNLALTVWLVHPWAIVGVAWGTAVAQWSVSFGFAPWYAQRILGVKLHVYLGEVYGRPLIAIIPFAVVTVLLNHAWPASGLVGFFIQVTATLPIAFLGAAVFALTTDERRVLLGLLRRALAVTRS